MALVMTPIYTQTVGAGGASSVTFNNIPQLYTDLKVVCSTRSTFGAFEADLYILPNADGSSIGSWTRLGGNGSVAFSQRNSGIVFAPVGVTNAVNATANTFNNYEAYIPNYSGSNFKQILVDSVVEGNYVNNTTCMMGAYLWRSASAVTSLYIVTTNNFVQNSTFSLYGIIRSGA